MRVPSGVLLDFVDGIPDDNLRATSSYEMTPEQRVGWEATVRSLYRDGMVRIVVTPTWAKLIDFETTLPSAVAELVRRGRSVRAAERRAVAALGGSPTPCTSLLTSDHRKRNRYREASGPVRGSARR
jgi:hypothetical protein